VPHAQEEQYQNEAQREAEQPKQDEDHYYLPSVSPLGSPRALGHL
jgi:hypothetical protein